MKSDRGHQTLKIALSKSVCVYSYLIFVGKYDSLPFVVILPKRHIHNTFHSIIQKFKNTGSIYVKSTKSKSNQNKKSNGNYQWNSSYVTKKKQGKKWSKHQKSRGYFDEALIAERTPMNSHHNYGSHSWQMPMTWCCLFPLCDCYCELKRVNSTQEAKNSFVSY